MKAVEMQFVLHKNDEAGLKQHQLNQRPVHDQSLLAHDAQKMITQQRHVTAGSEASKHASIRKEERDSKRGLPSTARNKKRPADASSETQSLSSEHPYKGRHIDLTL